MRGRGASLSISTRRVSSENVMDFSYEEAVNRFFVHGHLSIFANGSVYATFFRRDITRVLPITILRAIVMRQLLVVMRMGNRVVLFLRLLWPLVKSVVLTLRANGREGRFFLGNNVSHLSGYLSHGG